MKRNKKKLSVLLGMVIFSGFGAMIINSCSHAPYVLPMNLRTSAPGICFETDVLPVFISNCAKSGCHDANSHKGGYVLDNYQDIVKKGIVPGNSAASVIWESVAISTFDVKKMPENAPGLSAGQLDVIKQWIVAGAVDSGSCSNNCDSNNFTYSGAIAPMIALYCVGCHNSTGAAGGSLEDYNSVYAAAINGKLTGDISHLAGYNAMPLGGLQLSDCEIAQVTRWVAAGAPDN